MAGRKGNLNIIKVDAHLDAEQVGLVPFLANHCADRLAAKASFHTQDGDKNLETVDLIDLKAQLVLKRLVAIGVAVPKSQRPSKEVRAAARRQQALEDKGDEAEAEDMSDLHGYALVRSQDGSDRFGCLRCGLAM
eukprot:11666669-Karenia_brevis.AAC.1